MVTSADIANLVDEVLWHLTDEPEPVSEHDLLADLAQEDAFKKLTARSAVRRQSQQHFLMMHALYRLRERFKDSEFRLQMRPDAICLLDPNAASATQESDGEQVLADELEDETLREYYLDVTEFMVSEGSNISLDDPKRHHDRARRRDLYAALEIGWGANWDEVKAAYRQKAIENHPDRGGDLEQFERVRSAYRELKHSLHH